MERLPNSRVPHPPKAVRCAANHRSVPTDSAVSVPNGLKESAAIGRPVLLDFTAEWCKNCKAMELTTFKAPEVKAAMDGMIFVQVHADKPSAPETAALMKAFEVPGLPAYRIIQPEKK